MKLDDEGAINTVKVKTKEMDEKMKQLSIAWSAQTQGLHLDSGGQLIGEN